MDNSKIFSFYNVFKDVLLSSSSDKALSIQKLYLDGDGQMIYDERSKLVLWNYILNQKSLAAVKQAMKDNLNGKKQDLIKTFSYEIGEVYKQKVIGEGYSGTVKYNLLKDLTGMNIKDAQTWATNNNLSLDIEYVKNQNKANNIIVEQEYPDKKRIDLIPNATMKVKVVKNSDENVQTKVDCLIDPANSVCALPNLIGKTKKEFEDWGNKFSNVISRKYVEVESKENEGTILKILDGSDNEIKSGTTVKTLLDKQITLYINIAKKEEKNEQNTNNNENNNNENVSDKEKENNESNNENNNNNNNNENNNNQENPEPPKNNENNNNNEKKDE
jgi:beta-lactam-binding protein with PASTA domain